MRMTSSTSASSQNKDEQRRGRSPGPAASRRGSDDSVVSFNAEDEMTAAEKSASAPRISKRRKRSELSPSSKATHSIIEKERREAMNEKFSELAAQIPELIEAIASGKRPTKGEIVKASIARHQDQDRRIQEMQLELQALRAGNGLHGMPMEPTLVASMPSAMSAPPSHSHFNIPSYHIQPSNPIMVPQQQPLQQQQQQQHHQSQPGPEGSIWIGQLLQKANDQFGRCQSMQPIPHVLEQMAPVSPFKQTSMMSDWSIASLQQASVAGGAFDSELFSSDISKALTNHVSADQLTPSEASSVTASSSPSFTSADSDSSFGSEGLEPVLDEKKFLAESMGFEPFAMPSAHPEQTPLTSLIGLPVEHDLSSVSKKTRRITLSRSTASAKRSRKNDHIGQAPLAAFPTLLGASVSVNN